MADKLILDIQPDGIAILTFSRPHARNALDLEAMQHFAEAIARLEQENTLRVLILTGAGEEAFCSGGDLVELSAYPSAEDGLRMVSLMGDALAQMEQLPVPVIAAINGYALGGGSEIAVACDIRIVDEGARLGFVQGRMGLIPGWGGGQRLLRLVGHSRALEILLRASPMTPAELIASGLVNQVVPTGSALKHALELATQIVRLSPEVVRAMKNLLQAGLQQPYHDALAIERKLFPPLWVAKAHLEAVQDFLERRAR